LKKYFFYTSLSGWIISLFVHLVAISGYDIETRFSYIWILHIGIFIVFIPALIVLAKYKTETIIEKGAKANRKRTIYMLKKFIKSTPNWLLFIAFGGLVYAFFNFLFFMSSQHGTPELKDGQYFLQSHGNFIGNISEQEYHLIKANIVRGFSGHWIAFYGFATAVLFPYKKTTENM